MPHRYSPLLNFRPISAYPSQKDHWSPAVDMLRYPPIIFFRKCRSAMGRKQKIKDGDNVIFEDPLQVVQLKNFYF